MLREIFFSLRLQSPDFSVFLFLEHFCFDFEKFPHPVALLVTLNHGRSTFCLLPSRKKVNIKTARVFQELSECLLESEMFTLHGVKLPRPAGSPRLILRNEAIRESNFELKSTTFLIVCSENKSRTRFRSLEKSSLCVRSVADQILS